MNFSHDRILTEIATRLKPASDSLLTDGVALFATDDLAGAGQTGR